MHAQLLLNKETRVRRDTGLASATEIRSAWPQTFSSLEINRNQRKQNFRRHISSSGLFLLNDHDRLFKKKSIFKSRPSKVTSSYRSSLIYTSLFFITATAEIEWVTQIRSVTPAVQSPARSRLRGGGRVGRSCVWCCGRRGKATNRRRVELDRLRTYDPPKGTHDLLIRTYVARCRPAGRRAQHAGTPH